MEKRPSSGIRPARVAVAAALGALAVALSGPPASAQGLFDFLFGGGARRAAPPPRSYAPPMPERGVSRGDPPGPAISQVPSGDTGRPVAYCVRTCDGRYFPLQKVAGTSPADVCRSFCPASPTKVYNGSVIDRAVATDGTRYSALKTAFLYRDRLVEGCTCNGRDPLGIARIDPKDDPTLRSGDIVATQDGLQAYAGGRGAKAAGFTPIESYPGLSKDMRQKLLTVKVTPVPASVVTGPAPDDEARPRAETTGSAARDERGRRAQVVR